MRLTFQYRLYPNKQQEQTLLFWLRRCRELYNTFQEEWQAAWRRQHVSLGCFDQMNELPAIKAAFPAYQELCVHVLQDVYRRFDKTHRAFYLSLAFPDTPGWKRSIWC